MKFQFGDRKINIQSTDSFADIRNKITYLFTREVPNGGLFIIVVVLIGLYCIFADTPFSWL